MNTKQPSFDLVDAYLQGELSGEPLTEFETKMKNDPEFARFVQRQRDISRVVLDNQRHTFVRTLEKIARQEKVPRHNRLLKKMSELFRFPVQMPTFMPVLQQISLIFSRKYRVVTALAAVFLAAMCVTILYLHNNEEDTIATPATGSETSIFSLSEKNIPSPKMGAKDDMKVEGGQLYEQQEFSKAIPLFEKAMKSDTAEDLNLRLLLGIARLKTGDKEGALKEFQRITQQESLDSDIAWLGMAEIYRSNGDWVKSMAALRQIEVFQYSKRESLALAKKMMKEMEAERGK